MNVAAGTRITFSAVLSKLQEVAMEIPMQPPVRWLSRMAMVAAVLTLVSCDGQFTGPVEEPDVLLSHGTPGIETGALTVCKHVEGGNGVDFEFSASKDAVGPASELLESSFTLRDGDCVVVWRSSGNLSPGPGTPDPMRNVTVTELVPAGWQVDRVDVLVQFVDPAQVLGRNEVTVGVNSFHGALLVFHNSPVTVGTEGCTPGYWRNTRLEWPIDPAALFSAEFGVGPDDPLSQTVQARGGGENALKRHATAALLNASSGIDYPLTAAAVIALVQEAYATTAFEAIKDQLEAANELGCPLPNR
jgi:hypothetical protein